MYFSRIKSTIIVGYPIGSTWHKHYLKDKTTSKQRLDGLFIPKQKQKQKTQNKIGLPPNKRYHLTPLARHKSKDRSRYCHLW